MSEARKLTEAESRFIASMLADDDLRDKYSGDLASMRVTEMQDGQMGSLRFVSEVVDRSFGDQIAERSFVDEDGVTVWATLNVDVAGRLFELDVFKSDFSPLKAFPR
jgi:hypothetical protein